MLARSHSSKLATPFKALSSNFHSVKSGLNHIVSLVESKKPKLVLIANDVDPIELVVFLPALCRRLGVPYAIVKLVILVLVVLSRF